MSAIIYCFSRIFGLAALAPLLKIHLTVGSETNKVREGVELAFRQAS